jgi:UDP-glucuronate 4-epimerase
MKILVTGTAGFIGSHLAIKLLERGDEVVGLDNINDYYDQNVKYGRLQRGGIIDSLEDGKNIPYGKVLISKTTPEYKFIKLNLEDKDAMMKLFESEKFDAVCNLAAQAGVRYSLTNPDVYMQSNIIGFMNILEACRQNNVKNLSYASSSSVYGLNEELPFSTNHNVDHPISLYAASKKSNELMAHTYSHLFGISTTGLRFFTVYGPWGRPDMALFLFTKAALEGNKIDVFNNGEMLRDFTYIDDIVEGVVRILQHIPSAHFAVNNETADLSAAARVPYQIYNIGNNQPVALLKFIEILEEILGVSAVREYLPMQAGDVHTTYADIETLQQAVGFSPITELADGLQRFVAWFKRYHAVEG